MIGMVLAGDGVGRWFGRTVLMNGLRVLWPGAWLYGGVAQLGERLLCKQEVIGSIPFTSTRAYLHRSYSSSAWLIILV